MTSLLLILAIFCSAQLARGEGLHSTVYGYKKRWRKIYSNIQNVQKRGKNF